MADLTYGQLERLRRGEASMWSDKTIDCSFLVEHEADSTVLIDPDNIDTCLALFHCRNPRVCRDEFTANGVTKFWTTTEGGRPTGDLVILRAA